MACALANERGSCGRSGAAKSARLLNPALPASSSTLRVLRRRSDTTRGHDGVPVAPLLGACGLGAAESAALRSCKTVANEPVLCCGDFTKYRRLRRRAKQPPYALLVLRAKSEQNAPRSRGYISSEAAKCAARCPAFEVKRRPLTPAARPSSSGRSKKSAFLPQNICLLPAFSAETRIGHVR